MAELQPEWIIAGATVTMVIVVAVGFFWNYLALREMKKNREAQALPSLEFGILLTERQSFFAAQNIGNGIARNVKLRVDFEGYDNQPPIDTKLNIGNGADHRQVWQIDPIPQYIMEHGSTIHAKIKCEYEDIYGKKMSLETRQSFNQKRFPNK